MTMWNIFSQMDRVEDKVDQILCRLRCFMEDNNMPKEMDELKAAVEANTDVVESVKIIVVNSVELLKELHDKLEAALVNGVDLMALAALKDQLASATADLTASKDQLAEAVVVNTPPVQ